MILGADRPQQRSLYIAVAAIPTAYILYTVSRPGTDSSPHPFTRIINAYADLQSTWVERNNLHTKAVERVAHERNLFFNTPQPNHHELRFPEYVILLSVLYLGWNSAKPGSSCTIGAHDAHYGACRWSTPSLGALANTWIRRVFSTGSPYNVPAGHTANMDKLIAHYQDKAFADEQAKVEKLKASKE